MKLCMGCMKEIEENVSTCPYCGYNEKTLRQESYYLSPGTVIGGKYIVGRVLKYKGYAVKYIGMDAENNRRITVSEYLPSDFSTRSEGETEVTIYSGDALEQFNQGLMTFLNEGNRIQQLGAVQGITQVYDCVSENETGYIISEYLEGNTLDELLQEGKKYQPEEAKEFICTILEGLQKVHPLDIIHCDIAPETIFVTTEGEVKLLDFGSMRYVTTANSKSLAIILKQGYAPEEQYRSQGKRGPWTDIYALGAVMYRMITGKVPPESVDRTLEDTIEEPSKLVSSIPKGIENAMMNALGIYQKDRTATAERFYEELNNPDTKRIKVKKKKRDTGKLPIWVKGLVAVVVCAIIAGGVAVFQMQNKDRQRQIAGNAEERFSTGTGKTYQEFKKNWKKYGFSDAQVEIEYRYDTSVSEDVVKEFEDYTDSKCLVDGASLKTIEKDKKVKADKKIAKVIIASKEQYTFLPEWWEDFTVYSTNGKNQELTYDQEKIDISYAEGSNTEEPYGLVEKVSVGDKTYDDVSKLPNPLKKSQSVSVTICNGPYYMLTKEASSKNKGKYTGKKITDASLGFQYGTKQSGWKPADGTALKKWCDCNYMSFDIAQDTILKVDSEKIKQGQAFDSRRSAGETLFHIVGAQLSNGMTVGSLKKTANKCTVKKAGGGTISNNDIVESIRISKGNTMKQNGGTAFENKAGTVIEVVVKVEKIKTPQPTASSQNTPAPKKSKATKKRKKSNVNSEETPEPGW